MKYTIYHSLLQYSRDLQQWSSSSPQRNSGRGKGGSPPSMPDKLVQQLQQVIELFDDVILEEYSYDHKLMLRVHAETAGISSDHGSESPPNHGSLGTCDFCATDIFQSFFGAFRPKGCFFCDQQRANPFVECRKCVNSKSTETPNVGDGLLICPSCYVEGRSCKCEIMHPVQYMDFSVLLRDRNQAAQLLQQTDRNIRLRRETLREQYDVTASLFYCH